MPIFQQLNYRDRPLAIKENKIKGDRAELYANAFDY